jgi:hypothetical protein
MRLVVGRLIRDAAAARAQGDAPDAPPAAADPGALPTPSGAGAPPPTPA